MELRVGDWVEVRSKEEILRTLDKNGRLQGLPFMPQMFQYCGKRFNVYKRAHKTCDTINSYKGRRVLDAVHLRLRCDGKAYGDCQSACLIFWKEAWLKPVNEEKSSIKPSSSREATTLDALAIETACAEEHVWKATKFQDRHANSEPQYVCQATQLLAYTTPLKWWDIRQYWEDYLSGNVALGQIFCGFVYVSYFHLTQAKRNNSVARARWLYDQFQSLIGGVPFPRKTGTIPADELTPVSYLNLRPGEFVRVKSYKEILATLSGVKNRGMYFDAELVPYCGRVYRVKIRIERFVNERTGKLSTLKTPAVILDGVWCQSRYSSCRMFCPRSIYPWWREVWLERVDDVVSK